MAKIKTNVIDVLNAKALKLEGSVENLNATAASLRAAAKAAETDAVKAASQAAAIDKAAAILADADVTDLTL